MSTFKGCITNKVLPSIPSFLTSFSPLFPRALPFFRPAHKCSIVPAMVFEALFSLKWVATAPLLEFSCQNVHGSVSVTSMALLKCTSVFKFIPHYPDYCNVSSVTVNHPILFSSSNLWATQSLLHSYILWLLVSILRKLSCYNYNFAWDYVELEISFRRTGILITLSLPSHGYKVSTEFIYIFGFCHQTVWCSSTMLDVLNRIFLFSSPSTTRSWFIPRWHLWSPKPEIHCDI